MSYDPLFFTKLWANVFLSIFRYDGHVINSDADRQLAHQKYLDALERAKPTVA